MTRIAIAVVGMWLAASCGQKPAEQTPKVAEPVAPPTAKPTVQTKRVAIVEPKPAPTLPVKPVRAVLDAWLAAQNGGDFKAYERLFASDFKGVLRVGTKAKAMDRAAWMKSRRRMFKSKMKVATKGIAFQSGTDRTTILFTQHFQRGSFEDKGSKEIVVAKRSNRYLIVSERMLDSKAVATRFRPAGKGDVDPKTLNKSIRYALSKTHNKGAPPERLTGSLSFRWGRSFRSGKRNLLALVFTTPFEDVFGRGDILFVLADPSGTVLASHRSTYGQSNYSRRPPIQLSALPDRDRDGDGAVDIAITFKSGSSHGTWTGLALFTTRHPQLITDTYYRWAGEGSASGADWRYGCTTTVSGRLVVQVLAREQEWADSSSPAASTYKLLLLGTRPTGASKGLYAVQVAEHKVRAKLLPEWRKRTGLAKRQPWDWPVNNGELHSLPACAGAGAPLIVYEGVIAGKAGARYRLIRNVTWDKAAADKAAKDSGGIVVRIK